MKNDGGPAFPNEQGVSYYRKCDCGKNVEFEDVSHPGMSLRDYFAGKALGGMLAGGQDNGQIDDTVAAFMSNEAYILADAMLKEQKKPGND